MLPASVLYGAFALSGVSALLYQMIWQRALLTLYGSNVESVAMVIAAFLVGLGLGSLAGGWASKYCRIPLVLLFAVLELGIGLYGLFSLRFFAWAEELTLGTGSLSVGAAAFALIVFPTLLMGATLPILVSHRVQTSESVGRAVSWLYFANTLGAALGAFLAAFWALGHLGQSGSTRAAAILNALVALIILALWLLGKNQTLVEDRGLISRDFNELERIIATNSVRNPRFFPFKRALLYAAVSGFLALSWEILWARFYGYATGSRAPAFGAMMGAYLLGLAVGSLISTQWLNAGDFGAGQWTRIFGGFFCLANLAAFCAIPLASWMVTKIPEHIRVLGFIHIGSWMWTLLLVTGSAALQGAIFPLICHAAIIPDRRAGERMSYVHIANIIGSGGGSLLTGFVFLEVATFRTVAVGLVLVALTFSFSIIRQEFRKKDETFPYVDSVLIPIFMVCIGTVAMVNHWPRLFCKTEYSGQKFSDTWEGRHGVINVDASRNVYGNGVYDGKIDTSLTYGDWHVRPYFLSAVHPDPRRVLIIGMGAGPWTQIISNHPQVEHIDVVEINRTYLAVASTFPEVSGIFNNPKIHIHIDDGRRWLKRNRHGRYDAIVMNTTFHWREFTSCLLSSEFLTLAKEHLERGGIMMWNCTGSGRAAKTGMEVFPHTMMLMNNCIGSNSPITVNKERWRTILTKYSKSGIKYGAIPLHPESVGTPLFNLDSIEECQELERVLSLCDREMDPPDLHKNEEPPWWIVSEDRMRRLWKDEKSITDDNFGHEYEWQYK